ncbi:unnamed protein product [Microthlaspi erraticum]|uniref:C2H2-type domain-containing protein n=1 Tax=Microthlaspi erraticum TaxID=1685480 RepID=A0A6D2I8Q5_9BRAS|nr:unnamed protein product [Microthlaspi erraticum]
MRSHYRALPVSNAESSATGSTIPTLQTSNKAGEIVRSLETVLMRSVHVGEVGVGPKPDLKREEGGQQTTGKRKIVEDSEEVSSIEPESSLTIEEGAALCLVAMLHSERPVVFDLESVDRVLSARKRRDTAKYFIIDSEDDEEDSKKHVEDVKVLTSSVETLTEDNGEDDEEIYLVAREKPRKGKYKCETCGKILSSFQALGGHRTSHRNKRFKTGGINGQAVKPKNRPVAQRRYECQICGKVFESGQALGGHKKIHYVFLQPCKDVLG